MKVLVFLLIILISFWIGCEDEKLENSDSLRQFAEAYQIEPEENISGFLFLPLSGCEIYIDPLLSYMKTYWQCERTDENSRMVLSADWPKQLGIMTNYTKETIPDCIIFDSVNVAYFSGLVFNSPVGYEKGESNEYKKIDPGTDEWSRFLEKHFNFRIVTME